MSRKFNPYFSIVTVLPLGALLALGACSEQKKQPAATTTYSQPTGGVLQPVAAKVPDVQPQKSEKKSRPLTETWRSSTYGVSFDYPSKYSLTWGNQARLESDGSLPPILFIQDGGHRIALVQIHSGFFPKTDFDHAFFSVSVNRHTTADQCSKFDLDDEMKPDPEKGIVIGDKNGETRYVHDFVNNVCYEFSLGLKTRDISGIDDDSLRPVDRKRVFAKLEEMLESVSFDPDLENQTPEGAGEVKPEVKQEKKDTKTPESKPNYEPLGS
jgi:hypothetical protein